MRGKVLYSTLLYFFEGITPAYAGKSCHSSPDSAGQRDHPRLCGEKLNPYQKKQKGKGSPPPMRGKALMLIGIILGLGITPAYAGKSTISSRRTG